MEELEKIKTTVEYQGYYYRISDVIKILILGLLCCQKTMAEIHGWASSKRIRKLLEDKKMARDDIFLTEDGDLRITDGDISLTKSIRQAVLVRLRWFFSERRFAPEYGIPYFEQTRVTELKKVWYNINVSERIEKARKKRYVKIKMFTGNVLQILGSNVIALFGSKCE